jgi:hypothetical protein
VALASSQYVIGKDADATVIAAQRAVATTIF